VIAQCLAAAHKSVPSDFLIHSMHCYFVLAGNPDVPVIYHVERIRSGRSFATRTVQARQKGKVIFTTTMSFMKEGSGGKKLVEHFRPMPFVPGPEEDSLGSVLSGDRGPVISRSIDIWNSGLTTHSYQGAHKPRLLPVSPLQAMSSMDQGDRAHFRRRWPRGSSGCSGVHV
jgi:acyl-CoA thioesterase II